MKRYLLRRIVIACLSLFCVVVIVFVSSRLSGDVVLLLAPQGTSEAQYQEIRCKYGLDKPIAIQLMVFLKNVMRGDFGESIVYQRPAMEIVAERLPISLKLGLVSFLISNSVGIYLGVILAKQQKRWIDHYSKIFVLLGQAVPSFWLATMLMLIFSVKLRWLPTSGMGGINHMILPVVSLSWFSMSMTMRQMRSSLLDVIDQDYIKMARLKGNSENVVVWKHAMRNAAIPIVTTMSMGLTMIFGGQVFVETVYRWPGIGELMVSSITSRDYPLIQATVFVVSSAVIGIMFLKDLLYLLIDPRIKYE